MSCHVMSCGKHPLTPLPLLLLLLLRVYSDDTKTDLSCRSLYKFAASVSTTPTAKGKEEIDSFHPLYGLHYLDRKPLNDFRTQPAHSREPIDRTMWLKIEKGKVCVCAVCVGVFAPSRTVFVFACMMHTHVYSLTHTEDSDKGGID